MSDHAEIFGHDETPEEEISRELGEAMGFASICWDPVPDGIFKSEQAAEFAQAAHERILQHVKKLQSQAWEAGMVAAKLQAAGVKQARNPYMED